MATIFTRIVDGEIPCYKIMEDENFLAFLDISPLVKGHTLIIPKVEIDYIFDIDDLMLAKMMIFSKRVAKAIKLSIHCTKVGVSVIGLEVPHAHIHLIPMNNVAEMNFSSKKLVLTSDEMVSIAESIKSNL